jgi:hypothetical protein
MGKIEDMGADIPVEELVEEYPDSVGFLADEGILCIRCGEPVWGTLKDLVEEKGKDVDATVKKLTKFLQESN